MLLSVRNFHDQNAGFVALQLEKKIWQNEGDRKSMLKNENTVYGSELVHNDFKIFRRSFSHI